MQRIELLMWVGADSRFSSPKPVNATVIDDDKSLPFSVILSPLPFA